MKLAAGWLRREVSTKVRDVNQDTTWLQGVYSLTPKVLLDGGMFHVDNTDKGTDEDRSANLYVLRGTYRIDTQLSTYLSLAFMDNDSNSAYGVSAGGAGAAPVAGNSQFGTMLGGALHLLSASITMRPRLACTGWAGGYPRGLRPSW